MTILQYYATAGCYLITIHNEQLVVYEVHGDFLMVYLTSHLECEPTPLSYAIKDYWLLLTVEL